MQEKRNVLRLILLQIEIERTIETRIIAAIAQGSIVRSAAIWPGKEA